MIYLNDRLNCSLEFGSELSINRGGSYGAHSGSLYFESEKFIGPKNIFLNLELFMKMYLNLQGGSAQKIR